MQLKEYIESWSEDNIDDMKVKDVIEAGRTKLFDFDYPIFDVAYKNVFETHFIRNFYMREIGFETEGLFKFNLETWLTINMPYFNQLFESELMTYDPLTNAKTNDSSTRKNDGTANGTSNQNGNSTSSANNFNRSLGSNNPDTRLTITSNDGEGVIEYASEIGENSENNSTTSTGSATQTSNNTIDSTETYVASKTGKIGDVSFSKLMTEYRDSLLRIEKRIFNEMNQLFMLIY